MNLTDFRTFLTAGRATFTLTSRKSGVRFTYRVTEADHTCPVGVRTRYFVSVLTGPNNEADYTYAGIMSLRDDGSIYAHRSRGSKIGATAPSWLGFLWLLAAVNAEADISEQAEVDHMSKCGACRRPLTDPESIRRGLGPVCRKDLGL